LRSPSEAAGGQASCPTLAAYRLKPLQDKMQEYMDNGARLGWLINRQDRQVEIYRAGKPKQVLNFPQNLSGEDILPGFVLDLSKIW
jgi:Uma2 family endonuclease